MTWRSCMASSSAAWVLGGVRLISSARTMLAKIGPCTNRNARRPVVWSSSRTSVPVMSDGIRSGVNWMRLKLEVERLGDGLDHQRLGQAGHADQQGVAAGEDGGEDPVHHLVLADDPLRHLGAEAGDGLDQYSSCLTSSWGAACVAAMRSQCWVCLRFSPTEGVGAIRRVRSQYRP